MDIERLKELGLAKDICPNGHKWNKTIPYVRQTLDFKDIFCISCGVKGIIILYKIYNQQYLINKSKNHNWKDLCLNSEICDFCGMIGEKIHKEWASFAYAKALFLKDSYLTIAEFPLTCNEYIVKNIL